MRRNFFHALFILFCLAVLFTASSSHAHVLTSEPEEKLPDTITASLNHNHNPTAVFTKHDSESMRQILIRSVSSQNRIQFRNSTRKDSDTSADIAHKTRRSEIHQIISQRK